MDTQVIQEKGLPMDSHNPSVRKSTLGTPNLLWTKDTSCSLWPQDMGTPRTSHYKHQRPPHAPQALSTAPCSLSYLY